MALRCRERTITRKSRLDSAHFEPAGGRPATVTEALSACRLLMWWTAPGLSNRAASSRVQNASGSSHQSSQIKQVARPASDAQSNESPATVGLCFRETGLWGAETVASERAVRFNLSSAETKRPDENPPVRHYLHDTGKSLFARDCVVGLGGLELPTKRLSADWAGGYSVDVPMRRFALKSEEKMLLRDRSVKDANARAAGNPGADCDPVRPYADKGARSHVRAAASPP
jgi:hypothetical protein